MDESIGGAFMIKLLFVFIIIYVTFMCLAISYAKAFRIKNSVMNKLEQNQFAFGDDFGFIDDYLDSVSYNFEGNESIKEDCNNVEFGNSHPESRTILTENGVCIRQFGNIDASGNINDYYYKVTTYISVELPFFKIYGTIPISGETKIIY